jgi:glutamine cyclotransferase
MVDNHVLVLSWKNQVMVILDAKTLTFVGKRSINTFRRQGWGITYDGEQLIVSDGSSRLNFYKVPDFSKKEGLRIMNFTKLMVVREKGTMKEIEKINELEYVNGYVYANIWYNDKMIRINPTTGIANYIDTTSLYPKAQRLKGSDCFNGIAYNETSDTFLLTGKLWHYVFEVRLSVS